MRPSDANPKTHRYTVPLARPDQMGPTPEMATSAGLTRCVGSNRRFPPARRIEPSSGCRYAV
eukprot:6736984-Pyramimonas_sp.AAC.1